MWWPAILAELGKIGCSTNLYKLTQNFLSDREIQYVKNGAKIRKLYSKGCPQGSNLGPLLRNIVSNSALNLQLENNSMIQTYADDFIVIVVERIKYGTERHAVEVLKSLDDWSKKVKLQFCHKLTQMIFIT